MDRLIKQMQSLEDKLNYYTSIVTCTTFALMSIVVITQVIARSFFGFSFQWAEEMGRYFFIWSTMTAAACATHSHVHIGVDVLVSYLRGNVQRTAKIAAQLLLLFAVAVLTIYGAEQTANAFSSGQTATSFPVSAGVLYLSIPLSGALMLFYGVTQLLELIHFGKYRDVEVASDF